MSAAVNWSILYRFPIFIDGVFIVAILLAALEIGYRFGRREQKWKDADTGGGKLVLTTLFALLGLILAFTYSGGVTRYEARKQAVIIESNALGTAFLRADLVDEPGRTELRQALLEYARTRNFESGEQRLRQQTRCHIVSLAIKKDLIQYVCEICGLD